MISGVIMKTKIHLITSRGDLLACRIVKQKRIKVKIKEVNQRISQDNSN